MLKGFIKEVLPQSAINFIASIKLKYFDGYAKKYYAQEGEDIILKRLFDNKINGFYVDVGAHHPKRFSNTFLLYLRGWSGINIDAMPGSMQEFKNIRGRDLNIEIAISDKPSELEFYIFDEPALNTFSKELADSRVRRTLNTLKKVKKLSTQTMTQVLETYLPKKNDIDLLSIDIEGYDLKVLRSIDFLKYRPKVILIEILNSSLDTLMSTDEYRFLQSKDYILFSKLYNTSIFVENEFYYETVLLR